MSREIRRNGGYDRYRAALADKRAWCRAHRPKHCKLGNNVRLSGLVTDKLCLEWSPEQIAGWLKRTYPEDETYHVSHETIYRSLFVQARGVLKKELMQHLRSQREIRRSRHKPVKNDKWGQLRDIVSISERPASVEDRAVVVRKISIGVAKQPIGANCGVAYLLVVSGLCLQRKELQATCIRRRYQAKFQCPGRHAHDATMATSRV